MDWSTVLSMRGSSARSPRTLATSRVAAGALDVRLRSFSPSTTPPVLAFAATQRCIHDHVSLNCDAPIPRPVNHFHERAGVAGRLSALASRLSRESLCIYTVRLRIPTNIGFSAYDPPSRYLPHLRHVIRPVPNGNRDGRLLRRVIALRRAIPAIERPYKYYDAR